LSAFDIKEYVPSLQTSQTALEFLNSPKMQPNAISPGAPGKVAAFPLMIAL